jgi:tetratricopeptide (TPR) repeat protein
MRRKVFCPAASIQSQSSHQSIAREHPGNLRSLRGAGVDQMKIGDVERGLGDWKAALALYQGAVATFEGLRQRDPLNSRVRLYAALGMDNLGLALEKTGNTRAALEQYERASGLHRQLMQADPRNEMMANSYVLSLQAQADLLRNTGEAAAAKTAMTRYQEGLGIARRLAAADPGNVRRKGLCGDILVAMGALAIRTGDRAEAARDYREGLGLLKLRADRRGATPDDVSKYAEQLLACPLRNLAGRGQSILYARKAVALAAPSSAQRKDFEELLAKAEAAGR